MTTAQIHDLDIAGDVLEALPSPMYVADSRFPSAK